MSLLRRTVRGGPLGLLLTVGLLALTVLLASSVVASAEADPTAAGRPGAEHRWVHSWTAMPQLTEPHNMPPPPFTGDDAVLVDTTLRQTARVTTGGDRLRLRFSNAFGDTPLPLTAVTVALPLDGRAGVAAIRPETLLPVTFNGRTSVTVPVGAQIVSDPLELELPAGSNVTVTTYLAQGQSSLALTGHPGSRTTSYLLKGDHTTAAELPGATPATRWYLLSGIEVTAPAGTAALAVLGDSLSDGRGSTINGNDRWPDRLFDRLQEQPDTGAVAVLNQAAGGNRILQDGLGPNALARFDRDILAHTGVGWLIVFEGINDIGNAPATAADQQALAAELIAAYEQIIVRAHAHDIPVYGATLLPFAGHALYGDPAGHREAARQAVNSWIRTGGDFDAVLDFDRVVRDPDDPTRLHPALHDGDWLHLNPEGYRLLAEAVPADLFTGHRAAPAR
ncbi:SGNH/GDSL hydrolase family protein [Streptomyces sp. XM4011]|uniref:SGNH/GDSL hydrolase family protein n=1 Tax=Streptomyces sp. XM4011 TaxID=2929780 RepID=UPI001FF8A242|nr:SGNH/GDSL hydrolase family protein [Streptomyces sp. XM4011]MCK1814924.1 SGNH/GDSL hydrolase family protein [Streptomyces sp. XM4011]